MPKYDLETIVHAHLDAVNAHDLDQLMTFYADDAVMEFPASPRVEGKRAIRLAFQSFFEQWDERSTYRTVIRDGNTLAIEGTAKGKHRELHLRIAKRIPVGGARGYEHDFAMFLAFTQGKITRHRVYFDARDLVHQLLG